jgi:hypothetical protein
MGHGWKKTIYNAHDLREAWWDNGLADLPVINIDQSVDGDTPTHWAILLPSGVTVRHSGGRERDCEL